MHIGKWPCYSMRKTSSILHKSYFLILILFFLSLSLFRSLLFRLSACHRSVWTNGIQSRQSAIGPTILPFILFYSIYSFFSWLGVRLSSWWYSSSSSSSSSSIFIRVKDWPVLLDLPFCRSCPILSIFSVRPRVERDQSPLTDGQEGRWANWVDGYVQVNSIDRPASTCVLFGRQRQEEEEEEEETMSFLKKEKERKENLYRYNRHLWTDSGDGGKLVMKSQGRAGPASVQVIHQCIEAMCCVVR